MDTIETKPPMVVGINFSCPDGQRKEFIQGWAQEMEAWAAGLDEETDFTLLVVSLEACGGQATYRTVEDVPLVDVPCPCGDPNHWLVKWMPSYATTKTNMITQELDGEDPWTF